MLHNNIIRLITRTKTNADFYCAIVSKIRQRRRFIISRSYIGYSYRERVAGEGGRRNEILPFPLLRKNILNIGKGVAVLLIKQINSVIIMIKRETKQPNVLMYLRTYTFNSLAASMPFIRL